MAEEDYVLGQKMMCVVECNPETPPPAPKPVHHPLWRKGAAEFVGTFWIVVAGCGCVTANGVGMSTVVPMLTFGGVVFALILSLGGISGAHFNPNVTVCCLLFRTMSLLDGVVYVLAQMGGAVAGAGMLELLLPAQSSHVPSSVKKSAGCVALAPHMDPWKGMLVEAMATALLIGVILVGAIFRPSSNFRESTLSGPIAILFVLIAAIGFSGPLTGGAFNYARAFGPALVFNCWDDHWVWLVGTFLGSLLASLSALVFVPNLWHRIVGIHSQPVVVDDGNESCVSPSCRPLPVPLEEVITNTTTTTTD